MRRWMIMAALMLSVGAALPAWAGDREDCSWPEPAGTLLKTQPDRLALACRRQAERRDAYAQYNVGFLYETGQGVPQDHAAAMMWWQKAAGQGDARARLTLGLMQDREQEAPRAAVPEVHGRAAEGAGIIARHGSAAPRLEDEGVAAVATLAAPEPGPMAALPQLLLASFGTAQATVDTDIARLPKWRRVRDWMEGGAAAGGDPALSGWAAWAAGLRSLPVAARLDAINRRVNTAFPYAADSAIWGVRNYWPTPAEVAAKGAADCKGFAIMKFWLARLAGLDDGDLAFLVGIRPSTLQMHAVLLVSANGTPVVLDIRHPGVVDVAAFGDFRPLLAADLRGLKLFVRESSGVAPAEGPN